MENLIGRNRKRDISNYIFGISVILSAASGSLTAKRNQDLYINCPGSP